MYRMLVMVGILALLGGVGCGDDDGDGTGGSGGSSTGGNSGSSTGGASTSTSSGMPTGRVADILALSGDDMNGETVFGASCGVSSCHGSDGTGMSGGARDLTTFASTIDDAQLIDTILNGSSSTAVMPGLGAQLQDQEIADVVAYVRVAFP